MIFNFSENLTTDRGDANLTLDQDLDYSRDTNREGDSTFITVNDSEEDSVAAESSALISKDSSRSSAVDYER